VTTFIIPTWTTQDRSGVLLKPAILPTYQPPSIPAPNILPPAPPPDQLEPVSSVADKACGTCRKPSTPPTNAISGAPTPAPTPGARSAPTTSLPWWLYVLAALTLAQVVHGRND